MSPGILIIRLYELDFTVLVIETKATMLLKCKQLVSHKGVMRATMFRTRRYKSTEVGYSCFSFVPLCGQKNVHFRTTISGHFGFTLIESSVVLAIVGIIIALLFPALQSARESARRLTCQNSLRQQGIAAQGYHLNHEEFPAESYYDGTPSYGEDEDIKELDANHASYRVRLLPYLGQAIIQDVLERTATSKGIEDLSKISIHTFLCPSASKQRADIGSPLRYASHYYGIAGALGKNPSGEQYPTDPLQTNLTVDISSLNSTAVGHVVLGPFAHTGTIIIGGGVSIASILDGTTNTFLLGEISWNEYKAHRNWVRGTAVTSRWAFMPDGTKIPFPYTPLTSAKGIAENFPINIGKKQERVVQDFVCPDTGTIDTDTDDDADTSGAINQPEMMTLIVPVKGYKAGHGISGFGSEHIGGANFCYVDCSVHFFHEDTATSVLMSLATRDGGEVIFTP